MGGDTSRVRSLEAEVAALKRHINELKNATPYAARMPVVQRHPARLHPQDEAYQHWKRLGVRPGQIEAYRVWKRMPDAPR